MTKHFFRDSIQKYVFPWLTPHPVNTSSDVGYFQHKINDSDYEEVSERNQVGYNIIFNVAQDAITGGFHCVDENDEILADFDKAVQTLYEKKIEEPLLKGLARARLYGSSGILIGYVGSKNLSIRSIFGRRIDYVYALPNELISKKNPKTNERGETEFPLELANYELTSYRNGLIDGTRLVHLQTFSLSDDLEGTPVLKPVYDLLTVLKNADWSLGQNLFRNSSGLTFIIPGEGATQPQIDEIDDMTMNVNAKSVITLIPGCGVTSIPASPLSPAQSYDVLMGQISAGCNIPISILTGAQSGQGVSENDRRDYADFLSGLQRSMLTPALRKILELYQQSRQLPKQEFKIKWNPRSIFMIEISRAKLYDARTGVEMIKGKEVEARAALYKARAKYWSDLSERNKEKFEMEIEDKLLEEEGPEDPLEPVEEQSEAVLRENK